MIDRQKIEDLAFVLPWIGLFLLLPPVLTIFDNNTISGGLPWLPIYLFAVWFSLILACYWISSRLHTPPENGTKNAPKNPSNVVENAE